MLSTSPSVCRLWLSPSLFVLAVYSHPTCFVSGVPLVTVEDLFGVDPDSFNGKVLKAGPSGFQVNAKKRATGFIFQATSPDYPMSSHLIESTTKGSHDVIINMITTGAHELSMEGVTSYVRLPYFSVVGDFRCADPVCFFLCLPDAAQSRPADG